MNRVITRIEKKIESLEKFIEAFLCLGFIGVFNIILSKGLDVPEGAYFSYVALAIVIVAVTYLEFKVRGYKRSLDHAKSVEARKLKENLVRMKGKE